MNVVVQLGVGLTMLIASVAFFALLIIVGADRILVRATSQASTPSLLRSVVTLSAVTLWLALGLLAVAVAWAVVLYALGVLDTLYLSAYFSLVAFTTLGFGDVILEEQWWLLSGMIAANGFIIFGLYTAFLFDILGRLLQHDATDPGR